MQTELLPETELSGLVKDVLWQRAAVRECVAYGEHGIDTEDKNGHEVCFNCGGSL